MPKAYFMVRAVVTEPLRSKFDHWYSTDHLPRAIAGFKAEKGWRFWSTTDAGVHYAVYRFTDTAALEAAMKSRERVTPLGQSRSKSAIKDCSLSFATPASSFARSAN